MPIIDTAAAAQLERLREAAGHSPESLARELQERAKSEGWGRRGAVDAHTIRRIEDFGHRPGTRVRFVLASYFGVPVNEMWRDDNVLVVQQPVRRRWRRRELVA